MVSFLQGTSGQAMAPFSGQGILSMVYRLVEVHMEKITITVTRGTLKGQTFVFEQPSHCVIGRSCDCTIQLPREPGTLDVSRHHCLLEIDPPAVQVRDLGSLNGTFVNGNKIGQRPYLLPPEAVDPSEGEPHLLRAGDEIRVGDVVLRIGVHAPSGARQPSRVGHS